MAECGMTDVHFPQRLDLSNSTYRIPPAALFLSYGWLEIPCARPVRRWFRFWL